MSEMPTMATAMYASNTLDAAKLFGAPLQWQQQQKHPDLRAPIILPQARKEEPMANSTRRLVQVFIADPNESVPLADSLLYTGEQKLTDLTDQELFFEIDIKTLLDKHNAKRVKLWNKTVKERSEYLEPARIRDLKMVVVNVAQF